MMNNKILFYDLLDIWIEKYVKSSNEETTIACREKYVDMFKNNFENSYIDEMTTNDILDFKLKVKHVKRITLYNYLKILQSIFNYAISNNYIKYNIVTSAITKQLKKNVQIYVNYDKKYICKLIRLFIKTKLFLAVFLDLFTRNEEK